MFLEEAKAWIFRNGWGYTMFMYSEHALAHSPPQRDDPSPRCALTVVYIPSLRYRFCLLHCRRAALVVAELVAPRCANCSLTRAHRIPHLHSAVIWPLACVPLGAFGKSTFQLVRAARILKRISHIHMTPRVLVASPPSANR